MSLNDVLSKMKNIKYGFVDKGENIYPNDEWNVDFSKLYHLQSPQELIKNEYGVCWDQVELERYYLNNKCKTYFIIGYDNKIFPTHTFVVVEQNNKYYYLEHSWEPYRGIYEFNDLNNLLKYVKDNFSKNLTCDIVIYEYDKPKYGISALEFMNYCENGKKIDIV